MCTRRRSFAVVSPRIHETSSSMCGLAEQEEDACCEWTQVLTGIETLPYKILDCESSKHSSSAADPPFRILRELGIPSPPNGVVVYFSRHGESEYNVQDRIGGNPKLTPRGTLYARSLAQYFMGSGGNIRIWTSTLLRTIMTASYVESSYIREKTPLLNELHSGYYDGLTYREIEEQFPLESSSRKKDKLSYRYPGGESYLDCCRRLEPFLITLEKFRVSSLKATGDPLLIVSHQAALRCIFGYLLNLQPEQIPYVVIPQHTIIKVTFLDGINLVENIRMPVEHVENGVSLSKMKE